MMDLYLVPFWILGQTINEPRLLMQKVIDLPVRDAKNAWENGLREKLR